MILIHFLVETVPTIAINKVLIVLLDSDNFAISIKFPTIKINL